MSIVDSLDIVGKLGTNTALYVDCWFTLRYLGIDVESNSTSL